MKKNTASIKNNVIKFDSKNKKNYETINIRSGNKLEDAEPNSEDSERVARKFEKLQKKLRKLRKQENDPQADLASLKYMYDMTTELIPIAQIAYMKYRNDRGIYALNGLVNQARELMVDIRALQNGQKQVDFILNKILLPNMQTLLQIYLQDCAEFKKYLSTLPRKDRDKLLKQMDDMMRNFGTIMNNIQNKTIVSLNEYLIGK